MVQVEEVQRHFDEESKVRDRKFEKDPILGYEQHVRQKAVFELLSPEPGDLILDVGCGNGRDLVKFQEAGCRVVGLDLSPGMLGGAEKKLHSNAAQRSSLIRASATNLPLSNDSVDKVSCSEVIEHIPKWGTVIDEIVRVLRPGGILALTTPNRMSLYGFARPFTGAVHLYRSLRGVKSERHPHDEWKNQESVLDRLTASGTEVDVKLGVCFIPSHVTYLLPPQLKTMLVSVVARFENRLRWRLSGFGYMIALSAIKPL